MSLTCYWAGKIYGLAYCHHIIWAHRAGRQKDDEKSGADSTTCTLLVDPKFGAQWRSEIRTGSTRRKVGGVGGAAFPVIGSD